MGNLIQTIGSCCCLIPMNDLRLIGQKNNQNVTVMSISSSFSTNTTIATSMAAASINVPKSSHTSAAISNSNIRPQASTSLDCKTDFKKKKEPNVLPTIRFEIKLAKPSSDQFSEYNYNKLVVKALKIVKKKSKNPANTTLAVNDGEATSSNNKKKLVTTINKSDLSILDQELRLEKEKIRDLLSTFRKKIVLSNENILLDDENNLNQSDLNGESNTAQSMLGDENTNESIGLLAKSSNNKKSSKKKPKKNLYDLDNNKYKLKNFEHLGKGYDEDDSFIDNSEAIEEQVPADMAPKRGGFYINRGNLKLEKIPEQNEMNNQSKKSVKAIKKPAKLINENNANNNSDEEDDMDYEEEEEGGSADEEELDSDEDSDDYTDSDETDESDDETDETDDEDESGDEEETSLNKENESLENSNCETKLKTVEETGIEIISSTTNSDSAHSLLNTNKKRVKRTRKLINDEEDDEQQQQQQKVEENQMVVDEETIKENIENRNKLKQSQGTLSNMAGTSATLQSQISSNMNNMQHMNKKKRKTDSNTNGMHIESVNDGQLPSKLSRTTIKNEDIVELNRQSQQPQQQNQQHQQIMQQKKKINEFKQSGMNQTNNSKMIENQILNDNNKNQKFLGSTSGISLTNNNNNVLNKIKQQQQQNEQSESEEIINIIDTDNESNSNHKITNLSVKPAMAAANPNKKPGNQSNEPVNSNQMEMPTNVPVALRDLVNVFIILYFKNSSHLQNVWTDELKNVLFRIYKDSQSILTQNDRSQLFNFISSKTNKSKDSLMRHCRKLLNKEQTTKLTEQQQQHQPAQSKTSAENIQTMNNSMNTSMNNSFNQSPSQQHQSNSITLADLDDTIRNYLIQLDKDYQTFKQRNDSPKEKFFESRKITLLIWSTDNECKQNIVNNRNKQQLYQKHSEIKNFVINHMSRIFEMQRPAFIRILNQALINQKEYFIKEKITLLKNAIDEEMPKQQAKYKKVYDEYIRNKSILEVSNNGLSNADQQKKLNAPRKKFEWNAETRDLYLSIVSMKMELFRPAKPPVNAPQPQPEEEEIKRQEYLKNFLISNIICLWPDNWMQLNVLINAQNRNTNSLNTSNNARPSNQQQQINNSMSKSNENNTSNAFAPNDNNNIIIQSTHSSANIINIASKNGKQIKLEHQPLEQTCLPLPHTNNAFHSSLTNNRQQASPATQELKRAAPALNQISPTSTTSKPNVQIKEHSSTPTQLATASIAATKLSSQQNSPQITNIKQEKHPIQHQNSLQKNNPSNSPRPSSGNSSTSSNNNNNSMLYKQHQSTPNQINASPTNKQNVYENVVNQHKFNKNTPTSSASVNSNQNISTTTNNSNYIVSTGNNNNTSNNNNINNNVSPSIINRNNSSSNSQNNKSPTSIRNQQNQNQNFFLSLQAAAALLATPNLTQKFEQQQQQSNMFSMPPFINTVTSSPNITNNSNKTNSS